MANFDPTKPVKTRGGFRVRVICTDRAGDKPIVALVADGCGMESIETYHKDGYFYPYRGGQDRSSLDLVNVPSFVIEGWDLT